MTARSFTLTVACLTLASSLSPVIRTAHAQRPAREGRLLTLAREAPGVWLGHDRIYGPDGYEPLSACGAGGCAPVVRSERCRPPECPGLGRVYRVARDVGEVSDWPTDVEGYTRELGLLESASELRLEPHPQHVLYELEQRRRERADERERARHAESLAWISHLRSRADRIELSFSADVATFVETPGTYLGASAAIDFTFLLDSRDALVEDGERWVLSSFLGDQLGGGFRAHVLYRLDSAQEAEWTIALGIGPLFVNRVSDSVVRVPSILGIVAPEMGLILRADRDPTWYAAWAAPFSLLLDHDTALDLVARVFFIDDWLLPPAEGEEDPAEIILMLSAGVRLP